MSLLTGREKDNESLRNYSGRISAPRYDYARGGDRFLRYLREKIAAACVRDVIYGIWTAERVELGSSLDYFSRW